MPETIPPRSLRLRESDIAIHNKVGRLVEMRLCRLDGAGAFSELRRVMSECFDEIEQPAIVCADLRYVRILSPSVAQEMTQLLRTRSPRVLSSVAVVDPQDVAFGLLAQRMVRGADREGRQVFTESEEALEWLEQTATHEEAERARLFLLEGDAPPPSLVS